MPIVQRGEITESGEVTQASNTPFDVTITPDAGVSRVALCFMNITDYAFLDVTDVEATVDLVGAAVGKRLLFDTTLGICGVLAAAVAIPDSHTGDVTFTFTVQANTEGTGDVLLRYGTVTYLNVTPADALLATNYGSAQQVANPVALDLQVEPSGNGSMLVALGCAVCGGVFNDTINGAAVDSSLPIVVESDFHSSLVSFQSPVIDGEEGNIRYFGTEVSPITLIAFLFTSFDPPGDEINFNCECEDPNPARTLEEYRRDMLVRLGYAAVVGNPPPGMATFCDTLLRQAQEHLYYEYPALRTRRFFRWSLEEGVRYYGIDENDSNCGFHLEPYKEIEGVWLVLPNNIWLPMACGIPPEWYTTVSRYGIPSRYEIRQCLEVFPAPSANDYKLYIKGHFGLQPLVADEDKPTIDGEVVFLWALANAKAHYGQPDAQTIGKQAQRRLENLTFGTHLTKKYVPGVKMLPPAVMPLFLPLNGAPP